MKSAPMRKGAERPAGCERLGRAAEVPGAGVAVKFCGLACEEDLGTMNELRPDYVGFVFWPRSRRFVDRNTAANLREGLADGIATVGVFVDAGIDGISSLYEAEIISIAQLHGSEDDPYIERLRRYAPGIEVWKAFEISGPGDVEAARASSADMVLLDGGKGEGRRFPWELLRKVDRPFALAGGLDPHNVGEALASSTPAILDVSSGIEMNDGSKPPRKDPESCRAFIDAVRGSGTRAEMRDCSEPGVERISHA